MERQAMLALSLLSLAIVPLASAQGALDATAEVTVDIDPGPHVIEPGAEGDLSFDVTITIDNIVCTGAGQAVITFTSHPTGMDDLMPNGDIDDLVVAIPAGQYVSGATAAFEVTETVSYTVEMDDRAPAGGHVMVYSYTAHFDGETGCDAASDLPSLQEDFDTRIGTGDSPVEMEHEPGMHAGETAVEESSAGALVVPVAVAIALAGRRRGDGL